MEKICQTCIQNFQITKQYIRTVYTPPYKLDLEKDSKQVFKYVGKHHKPTKRIHVCGLTVTGALGVAKLPNPVNKLKQPPRYKMLYPYNLSLPNITKVACGYGYSIFANESTDITKIWGTGINMDSQIGFHKSYYTKAKGNNKITGSFGYLMEPIPIHLPLKKAEENKILDLSCGRAHTLILTDKEGVFSMGNNALGQCGREIVEGEIYIRNAKIHNIPHHYFPSPVISVTCGMDHSIFLTKNGEVFSCGWGADGQTGLGTVDKIFKPKKVGGDIEGVKIVKISATADTNLALSENNEVFAWGSSEYNQLGCVSDSIQIMTPTLLPFTRQGKVIDIAMGGTAGLLLTEDNIVHVWGYGILGKGPELIQTIFPKRIPQTLFGQNDFNYNDVKICKVQCGLGNFAAITDKGELFTWGKNRSGCLGIGEQRDQYFPWKVLIGSKVTDISMGPDHTIILSRSLL